MTTIGLNDAGIRRITSGLENSVKNCKPFFEKLAAEINRMTLETFRLEGLRSGHEKWRKFSPNTLKTPAGTWKLRYGTDMRGLPKTELTELKRAWGWGHVGDMRRVSWRYSDKSRLLQSSGSFMRSFKTLEITNKSMTYGTKYHAANGPATAADIINDREVLFVTPQDVKKIRTDFLNFVRAGIKI